MDQILQIIIRWIFCFTLGEKRKFSRRPVKIPTTLYLGRCCTLSCCIRCSNGKRSDDTQRQSLVRCSFVSGRYYHSYFRVLSRIESWKDYGFIQKTSKSTDRSKISHSISVFFRHHKKLLHYVMDKKLNYQLMNWSLVILSLLKSEIKHQQVSSSFVKLDQIILNNFNRYSCVIIAKFQSR